MTTPTTENGCAGEQGKCEEAARMALRTARPTRDVIKTIVYWDDRTAPRTAERLCQKHGMETLDALSKVLVDR